MSTGTTAMDGTPSPEDRSEAGAHGITWGVRASFLAYIRGMTDGSLELGEGAVLTPEGAIRFPFSGVQAGEEEGERWIRCRGGAVFQGHFGMLTIPLRNLAVRVVPDGATLLTEQTDGTLFPLGEVMLGEPEITADGVVWTAAPVVLSEPGSRFFGSSYPPGTPMDPLLIRLPPLT